MVLDWTVVVYGFWPHYSEGKGKSGPIGNNHTHGHARSNPSLLNQSSHGQGASTWQPTAKLIPFDLIYDRSALSSLVRVLTVDEAARMPYLANPEARGNRTRKGNEDSGPPPPVRRPDRIVIISKAPGRESTYGKAKAAGVPISGAKVKEYKEQNGFHCTSRGLEWLIKSAVKKPSWVALYNYCRVAPVMRTRFEPHHNSDACLRAFHKVSLRLKKSKLITDAAASYLTDVMRITKGRGTPSGGFTATSPGPSGQTPAAGAPGEAQPGPPPAAVGAAPLPPVATTPAALAPSPSPVPAAGAAATAPPPNAAVPPTPAVTAPEPLPAAVEAPGPPTARTAAAGATPLPPSGATPLPPSGATPLPPSGATPLPPSGATPLPPSGATPLPPSGATPLPPSGATPLPPSGATPLPPSGATPLPPSGATPLPPSGATPLPPSGATPLPPSGATPLPPSGATPLPPSGATNSTRPPPKSDLSPPASASPAVPSPAPTSPLNGTAPPVEAPAPTAPPPGAQSPPRQHPSAQPSATLAGGEEEEEEEQEEKVEEEEEEQEEKVEEEEEAAVAAGNTTAHRRELASQSSGFYVALHKCSSASFIQDIVRRVRRAASEHAAAAVSSSAALPVFVMSHPGIRTAVRGEILRYWAAADAKDKENGKRLALPAPTLYFMDLDHLPPALRDHYASTSLLSMVEQEVCRRANVFIGTHLSSISVLVAQERVMDETRKGPGAAKSGAQRHTELAR
ncbi:hypothetical protein HYH03_011738 [Edaphochlamys debaryana]|uniref:Uncharacterized protein n=1 Tax=Edaphochlamys debaryana TaxID=47281 RepID=A0A835XVF8_9CHLO|nr:hypothetical protein HYH03_011738 [Edaphochlamys debaryana]|eukprot:KAG2489788.1 hypothetical protein HYH03_011738 [Edaphochlamys debaryana]